MDVAELFRLHAAFVERVLARAGVAPRDLSDATQEVFLVVHRRAHEFEGRASVRTWLYRIAWHVASETRRRAFRRRERLDADLPERAVAPRAEHCPELRDSVRALLDAIDRLDADKRETLVAHELDETPMHEVAARLRIPLKTAFSRLYAARRALREELGKQGLSCGAWWLVLGKRAVDWPIVRVGSLSAGGFALAPLAAVIVLLMGELPALAPVQLTAAALTSQSAAAHVEHYAWKLDAVRLPASRAAAASSASRGTPHRAGTPRAAPVVDTPATAPREAPAAPRALVVIHMGDGSFPGPFGENPLAKHETVAPYEHPRAKLALFARR
ncbi:MAG TPA: sigma-70 family RNA polymerase sigma factor [Polyangiales bacterium]|nr:sigma-70 family RNA polymerase sigma factor [Polyangiales bacterium]